MLWTTTAIAFLGSVAFVLALIYALSPGQIGAAQRLVQLWHPPAAESKRPESTWKAQGEFMQRLLARLGKLFPAYPNQPSRTQRMLVRAGYRSPEALLVLRGAKLLLVALLPALAYLTGAYHYSPAFILGFAAVLGYVLPELWLSHCVQRRQQRLRRGLPDALDLLVICVEAGLGLDQGILRVAQELHLPHPELSEEFQLVNLEMRVGKGRLDALRELGVRTGVEDIKALVAMLVQTDRFGTSVAQSLRVHSDDMRTKRRQRAEEMAAKTTVKMVPPLVFFIFPALLIVILGPAIIMLVRQLLPVMK